MSDIREITSFVWIIADEVLRDDLKRGKYPDVILPFVVLRRIDCVLAPTRDKVRQRYEQLKESGLKSLDGQLRRAAGHSFYNTSGFDFQKLVEDPKNVGKNVRSYVNGFSENLREVLDKFKIRTTIDALEEKGLLFLVVRKFNEIDLSPDKVDNHEIGTVFEELIRRFNEQSNENPGEHFTPRDVIRLMVRLIINGDREILRKPGVTRSIYDCCCGTGGMLTTAKEYTRASINSDAAIHLYGQEVNDETYAVCKADLLLKGEEQDAENIKPGSCFKEDGHPTSTFDYMIANPPYGKDWNKEADFIRDEHARGERGRFAPGLPRSSDGQLLFLMNLWSKRRPVGEGGSRMAIIMNGSPLFTGDAGSGESEIRRWALENDWLEAIVSLPNNLFYNTGIGTYVWVLTNRKPRQRKGKVLLVNGATTQIVNGDEIGVFARKMRRSLGDKRNELAEEHVVELARLAHAFEEGPYCKVFEAADFGYRRITVERPLRLNFQASPERIAGLPQRTAFVNLARSRKTGKAAETEMAKGRELQQTVVATLKKLDGARLFKNRDEFTKYVDDALTAAGVRVGKAAFSAILDALSERDASAEICRDEHGNPEPDPELRDYENVPLKEDIYEYFARKVTPHVPDAWINETVRDERDGKVGKIGYEVNFGRYFFQYQPPRPLAEIDADIQALESEVAAMLREVTA